MDKYVTLFGLLAKQCFVQAVCTCDACPRGMSFTQVLDDVCNMSDILAGPQLTKENDTPLVFHNQHTAVLVPHIWQHCLRHNALQYNTRD